MGQADRSGSSGVSLADIASSHQLQLEGRNCGDSLVAGFSSGLARFPCHAAKAAGWREEVFRLLQSVLWAFGRSLPTHGMQAGSILWHDMIGAAWVAYDPARSL